jgi:hypothetical protein
MDQAKDGVTISALAYEDDKGALTGASAQRLYWGGGDWSSVESRLNTSNWKLQGALGSGKEPIDYYPVKRDDPDKKEPYFWIEPLDDPKIDSVVASSAIILGSRTCRICVPWTSLCACFSC